MQQMWTVSQHDGPDRLGSLSNQGWVRYDISVAVREPNAPAGVRVKTATPSLSHLRTGTAFPPGTRIQCSRPHTSAHGRIKTAEISRRPAVASLRLQFDGGLLQLPGHPPLKANTGRPGCGAVRLADGGGGGGGAGGGGALCWKMQLSADVFYYYYYYHGHGRHDVCDLFPVWVDWI